MGDRANERGERAQSRPRPCVPIPYECPVGAATEFVYYGSRLRFQSRQGRQAVGRRPRRTPLSRWCPAQTKQAPLPAGRWRFRAHRLRCGATQAARLRVPPAQPDASARRCVISLAVDGSGDLQVDVADDGVGIRAHTRGGVGLPSMRERAAELGGSCSIERSPAGGTRVHAVIPLNRSEPGERSEHASVPATLRA